MELRLVFDAIFVKFFYTVLAGLIILRRSGAYYDSITCYGTGDCIISLTSGGHADDQHKWNTECHDGEAIVAIQDYGSDYQGFGQVWCKFMFPRKPPTFGMYPYYPWCNIRDMSLKEYYCYDKMYPSDTYDTFMTALSSMQYFPGGISVSNSYKCCRLPEGYHLDYRRCEYKYTHDRWGEHYDGIFWFVICEKNYLVTGLGQSTNPWTNALHYVWIQCCPLVFNPFFQPPYPPSPKAGNTTRSKRDEL
ncbi:uncharacterized protein LOC129592845 [Paramacrobiotus metropolitanus]|uniref:uncharacterized protein LOC129592845 n=1 Tax=Paramacrobiotus metropolitanus TaxID=2943436 RepID=UPI0024457A1A|nr:uncharacterized protein LOC129592845 [Paramacrobiotus metropolitanus]